jgi:hypothetical protein
MRSGCVHACMYVRINILVQSASTYYVCNLFVHFVHYLSPAMVINGDGNGNGGAVNVNPMDTEIDNRNGSIIDRLNMTTSISINGTDAINGKLLRDTE